MKNKILIILLFFQTFFPIYSYSDDIEILSSNIQVFEEGNLIHAYKAKAFIESEDIEIEGDKSIYDKKLLKLTIIKNAKFYDKKKDIYIEGEKLIYDKLNNIVYSEGKTFLNIENTYEVFSKNLYFDRNIDEIFSDNDTTIKDPELNVYNLEEGFILENIKKILTSRKANIIDRDNNNYNFEKSKVDLNKKIIVGKEIKVDFIDSFFGNEENDPILKGKSIVSDEKNTTIYKSVFSTCNIENKDCRGWELESDIFNHDKEKQIFEYKKSWLKMFGKKVAYFPYFNHPDPSVKRKSGFLTPSYASSSHLGGWTRIPYFKVISEDKDMTLNPKIYIEQRFLLQTEYRQEFKNSSLIADLSYNNDDGNTNTHFFTDIKGELNETTNYKFKFQNVTNDNYLKLHNLRTSSDIIESDTLLTSEINIDKNVPDDYNLSTSVKVFEDLSKAENDKYQFIFPDFNFKKKVDIDDRYNGNFTFTSTGFQKNYDTNIYEAVINNDFLFESLDLVSDLGISNKYSLLLANYNSYAENSSTYNDNNNHELYQSFLFQTSFPMVKKNQDSKELLKPRLSFKYSPNNSNDMSTEDKRINYSNIFSLNRLGSSKSPEKGQSITLGLEYEKQNLESEKILGFKIANSLTDKKNDNLPTKSKLNETRSDIVGDISFIPNKMFEFNYEFSIDRDLKYTNYDSINAQISINNVVTTFNYLTEHNEFGDSEVVSNTTKVSINDESSIDFKTTKDLNKDFTEYYNLIYNYETDCLSASLEYNKKFYRDGNIEPVQDIFLLIKFIPFVEVRAKDTGR